MKKLAVLLIQIDEELKKNLKAQSAIEGKSIKRYVSEAIEEKLKRGKK